MVWFFSRESEVARYEIRQRQAGGYELVVTRSAGEIALGRESESFAHASQLIERSLEKQEQFLREGWQPEPVRLFAEIVALQALEAAA